MPRHASQERSRRQHASTGEDDEASLPLLVSRVDDPHNEVYSRSHLYTHHGDSYKPSSSGKGSFNMNRESTSSRHESSRSSYDRHTYPHSSDTYHRGSRDDYDVSDSRDTDLRSSRTKSDLHHVSSREHTRSYDQKNSGSAYESNSWATSTSYEGRAGGYNSWPSDDRRGDAGDEWGRSAATLDDRRGDAGDEWTRSAAPLDDRRDRDSYDHSRPREDRRENDSKSSRRDNGWEPRRRDRTQGRSDSRRGQEDSHLPGDDRSWEPSSTWQHNGDQGYRSHNGSRNNGSNRSNKGGKKNQSQNKQRRRMDEDNLNNWQRRDTNSKKLQTTTKRRAVRSSSRSRSRSPDSHYSRRSRSRSRSVSPRRRQRVSSPVRPRSRTPSDRGRPGWHYQGREYSRSPVSSHRGRDQRGRPRRRSISSASTTSRSRSSSRSPVDRPRAKHRLPPATSIKEISLSISKTSLQQRSNLLQSRDPDSRRNGRYQMNGKHVNRNRAASPRAQWNSGVEMPPPSIVPTSTVPQGPPSPSTSIRSGTLSERSAETHTPRARPVTLGRAGFKPIGQASSAVKRFFPGDDDEDDDNTAPQPSPVITAPRVASASFGKHTREDEATDRRSNFTRGIVHEAVSVKKPLSVHAADHVYAAHDAHIEAPHDVPYSPLRHPGPEPSLVQRSENDINIPLQQPQVVNRDADEPPRPSTPSAVAHKELYAIVSQVGEGTFGKVYKARNTVSNVHVALKRIRMEAERDGFPVTAMREIKLLQSLRHQNIVRLYEMMVSNGSVFMVFEYMDHDLTGVLSQTQFSFSEANLKSLCSQMLGGLAYLHHKGVVHRDIKGSNILINNKGELKLADFGLARFYQKRRRSDYTNRVITLWYRPPELLFGATIYGPEVDMWSAGCIMLELYTKKPIFQGNDEIHQLDVIYKILGTPTPERWPGVTELPWYELVKPKEVIPDHFRELFQKWMSPAALDLAELLLAYDPAKRVSASQALETPYFTTEDPPAALPVGLSTLEGEWHELETKRERAKKRRKLESGPP